MSFIIAAPASGSGKTTITLGLLHALSADGVTVRGAKSGPDYIDPAFHAAACGQPCMNLDAWAMRPNRIEDLAAGCPLIIEGAMGLFDGAPDGKGATADLARLLQLPVIMVVDASRMAQSIAPLIAGFAHHDPNVQVAGVILNKTGSARHRTMLADALRATGIPLIGCLPRASDITQPERHLGLVQAQETPDLASFLKQAAALMRDHLDFSKLPALAPIPQTSPTHAIAPPGQRIAIANDHAFAFTYPHVLADWRAAGAEILPFSPLADEAVPSADFIFLPGGYPELHAGRLSANAGFLASLRAAAATTPIYGECGGYMTLGQTLTDASGKTHQMAGLLNLQTSFAERKLHLGYRHLTATTGPFPGHYHGHEFHYATTIAAEGTPLFVTRDATGAQCGDQGLIYGKVSGSFAHIIDSA